MRLIFQYLFFPSAVTGWRLRSRRYTCCQLTHELASCTEIRGKECHHQAIFGRYQSKRPGSAVDMCVGHAPISARRHKKSVFSAAVALDQTTNVYLTLVQLVYMILTSIQCHRLELHSPSRVHCFRCRS